MPIDEMIKKFKDSVISGDNLKTILSGESSTGQFRVKWLRWLLVGCWWLAAVFLILAFLIDLLAFFSGMGAGMSSGYGGAEYNGPLFRKFWNS